MNLKSVIIRAERHGVPQCRHRIIIVGIRKDLKAERPGYLEIEDPVPVNAVLDGMPRLRSGLSKGEDNAEEWLKAIRGVLPKLKGKGKQIREVRAKIREYLDKGKNTSRIRQGRRVCHKKEI